MRVCDLGTGVGRLQEAAKILQEKWIEAQRHWDDQTSKKFQEHYLQPLAPKITMTVSAVSRLAEILDQAERACSEEAPAE